MSNQANTLTQWQNSVINETVMAIESSKTLDSLAVLGVDLLLTKQQWLRQACWNIYANRRRQIKGEDVGKELVIIVDVMNWVRSDFSMDGDVNNCVQAFFRRVGYLSARFGPQWIVCASDTGETSIRKTIRPEYKSSRDPRPSQINIVGKIIKDECLRLQICYHESGEWEADDISASVTTQAVARGYKVMICTNDRDHLQLVCNNVVTFSGNEFMNVDAVADRYGIRPDQICDWLCLTGKDDLVSCEGIGPKTATELLQKYDNFYGIFDARHTFTERKRIAMEEFAKHYWHVRECHMLNRRLNVSIDWSRTHCM